MYRNYFYREDLKVELTQLEEEDEKERFLEGSKHKRLIPGYVALEVKENTCKISPVLYPEFRGKGYWKDAENFCWKESLKKDLSNGEVDVAFGYFNLDNLKVDLNYTLPVMKEEYVVLGNEDILVNSVKSLKGKTVLTVKNTLLIEL